MPSCKEIDCQSIQESTVCVSCHSSHSSLLGRLLALLALLLGALSGGGSLLDAVKLLNHESASDSTHEKNEIRQSSMSAPLNQMARLRLVR